MIEVLVESLVAGDRRALARALTLVETGGATAKEISNRIYPHIGQSRVIGFTGAPGTGKSTLVNELTKIIRAEGIRSAILAIDPSSPFTGGAIMGDRVRMQAHSGDPGVYIRSMATRGKLGGLANATRDAIRVLDAAGFPLILLETVGTGQSEVDVAKQAHTTVVILAPGLGDDVQAIKAGLLEIADILVVNKADRPGAMQTVRSLQQMLDLGHPSSRVDWIGHHQQAETNSTPVQESENVDLLWHPPILRTVATRGEGIKQMWDAIKKHYKHLEETKFLPAWSRAQLANELRERTEVALTQLLWNCIDSRVFDDVLDRLERHTIDPHDAVEYILSNSDLDMDRRQSKFQLKGD